MQRSFKKTLKIIFGIIALLFSISEVFVIIEILGSQDEMGELANSFRQLIGDEHTMIHDITHIIKSFNQGDFNVGTSCRDVYKGSFQPILNEVPSI